MSQRGGANPACTTGANRNLLGKLSPSRQPGGGAAAIPSTSRVCVGVEFIRGFTLCLKFPQSGHLRFHAGIDTRAWRATASAPGLCWDAPAPGSHVGDAGVGHGSRFGCCAPAPEPGRAPARCPLLPASRGGSGRDPASRVKNRQERGRGSRTLAARPAAAGWSFGPGFEGCRIRPAAAGQQCWVVPVVLCPQQRGDAPSGAGGCAVAAVSRQRWGGHWVAGTPLLAVPHPHPVHLPHGKARRGAGGFPTAAARPPCPPQPTSPPTRHHVFRALAVFTKTGEKSSPWMAGALIRGGTFSPPIR